MKEKIKHGKVLENPIKLIIIFLFWSADKHYIDLKYANCTIGLT